MSDFTDLGLTTRNARPGEPLEINYVGPHGILGFTALGDRSDEPEVVCVPPGTELLLSKIPQHLQTRWGTIDTVSAIADVRTPNPFKSSFRDGILISGCDGHVSLQELPLHLVATVRASA